MIYMTDFCILLLQNINNNNNNDNNNSNNNNNKNTNENRRKKKSVTASAAVKDDLEIVNKLLEKPLTDRRMANDIMNLFIEDIIHTYSERT